MILHLIRAIFLLMVLALTISFAYQQQVVRLGTEYITLYILIPAFAALAFIFVDMFWRDKRLNVLSGLFFGLLAGLAVAYVVTTIVDMMAAIFPAVQESPITQLVKAILAAAAVFLCVTIVMQTKDDFRFIIPYVEFAKQTKGSRPMLLDTSVIIDGRIADLVETKIFTSQFIVPRFVLSELQAIADSQDKLKRNRGRRGLDVLQSLQNNENADISILDANVPSVQKTVEVDAKLVALAEHLGGRIMTNDYNLNKVAQLRNIDVINLNDISNALKPIVLPGETMEIKVIKPGEGIGQGVGYLDDGTMVVVDQGRDSIGRDIQIVVTSVLQTSAGRMIFGKKDGDKTEA
ncbi:MAG TPA: PIN/TRAM domain-containing protein [Phycisphaerae bacterium]|nr:PIN/TRAM domain-containing protein [Phycisphaerae bacterium]